MREHKRHAGARCLRRQFPWGEVANDISHCRSLEVHEGPQRINQ